MEAPLKFIGAKRPILLYFTPEKDFIPTGILKIIPEYFSFL
jgi:hypothetical protein